MAFTIVFATNGNIDSMTVRGDHAKATACADILRAAGSVIRSIKRGA